MSRTPSVDRRAEHDALRVVAVCQRLASLAEWIRDPRLSEPYEYARGVDVWITIDGARCGIQVRPDDTTPIREARNDLVVISCDVANGALLYRLHRVLSARRRFIREHT